MNGTNYNTGNYYLDANKIMDTQEVIEVWSDIECDDSDFSSEVSENESSENEDSERSADEDRSQCTWSEVPGTSYKHKKKANIYQI